MTPTRTLSAVLVWPRASERISVTDLGIQEGSLIFGGRQRPIILHFAAHYEPTMDVVTRRKSVNIGVIRWRRRYVQRASNIFFDS
jgi:hypothetical protein